MAISLGVLAAAFCQGFYMQCVVATTHSLEPNPSFAAARSHAPSLWSHRRGASRARVAGETAAAAVGGACCEGAHAGPCSRATLADIRSILLQTHRPSSLMSQVHRGERSGRARRLGSARHRR
jgi:hypothetical protein